MIKVALFTVITAVIGLFGASNLQIVELHTVFTEEVQASLAFLLGVAFSAGFAVSTLMTAARSFNTRREHRRLYQETMANQPLVLPEPPLLPARVQPRPKRRFWRPWR
jgi:uncharacterized membrane protein YciS (DUF1049 family)